MNYISPYLLTPAATSPKMRKSKMSVSEVLIDPDLSIFEKRELLDLLEQDVRALITLEDESFPQHEARSPTRMLEEIHMAQKSLYRST